MKPTDQTLLEQLRITEPELQQRRALFGIGDDDLRALHAARPLIQPRLEALVAQFHEAQTAVPDIALLIGDAETAARLRGAQHRYLLRLFSGDCDLDYVNSRLRIGQVHKRAGVEPRLHFASMHGLQRRLVELLGEVLPDPHRLEAVRRAVEKLMMFDLALVMETYIRGLVSDAEIGRERAEHYANTLADKLRERSEQLDERSRADALTGLLDPRHLGELLGDVLRAAQRRAEPVTVASMGIGNLGAIIERHGRAHGDEVLRAVASAIRRTSRESDHCFRHGDDAFCVILQNCRESQAREHYLARLRDELELLREPVSVRIGFVETGVPDYRSAAALIDEAQQAAAATVIQAPRVSGTDDLIVKPA